MSRMVYLDMDGVLADFYSAACKVHNREVGKPQSFYYSEEWGMTRDEFWAAIDAEGEGYWEGLEKYPWFDELLEMSEEYGYLVLCTSPSKNPACLAGKMRWIQKHFGRNYRNYIFTPRKYYLARPGAVLIDDKEASVSDFNWYGGRGVLFPQSWNKLRDYAADPLPIVREQLEA